MQRITPRVTSFKLSHVARSAAPFATEAAIATASGLATAAASTGAQVLGALRYILRPVSANAVRSSMPRSDMGEEEDDADDDVDEEDADDDVDEEEEEDVSPPSPPPPVVS